MAAAVGQDGPLPSTASSERAARGCAAPHNKKASKQSERANASCVADSRDPPAGMSLPRPKAVPLGKVWAAEQLRESRGHRRPFTPIPRSIYLAANTASKGWRSAGETCGIRWEDIGLLQQKNPAQAALRSAQSVGSNVALVSMRDRDVKTRGDVAPQRCRSRRSRHHCRAARNGMREPDRRERRSPAVQAPVATTSCILNRTDGGPIAGRPTPYSQALRPLPSFASTSPRHQGAPDLRSLPPAQSSSLIGRRCAGEWWSGERPRPRSMSRSSHERLRQHIDPGIRPTARINLRHALSSEDMADRLRWRSRLARSVCRRGLE